jgi:hypothetical protein
MSCENGVSDGVKTHPRQLAPASFQPAHFSHNQRVSAPGQVLWSRESRFESWGSNRDQKVRSLAATACHHHRRALRDDRDLVFRRYAPAAVAKAHRC